MKQFKCDSCGKEFDRKKNLIYHINNKVCDDKKYDCKYCENKFSTKTSMYRHMKHVCKKKKEDIEKKNNISLELEIVKLKEQLSDKIITKLEIKNKNLEIRNKNLENENEYLKSRIKSNQITQNNKCTKTQKYKKKKIPKNIRNIVWDTHMGADFKRGICCCCGVEPITFVNFQCGHIESEVNGGETHVDNLLPICQSCNGSMGSMNLNEYKEKYGLT
jgi:hypothetical protein